MTRRTAPTPLGSSVEPLEVEERTLPVALEVRAVEGDGGTVTLQGRAVPYGELSNNLGGFVERFEAGALTRTFTERLDVRCYADHDMAKVLGRVSKGTLRMESRADGLHIEVDPPATSYAKDVVEVVKRGDLGGLSIAFRVMPGGERWDHSAKPPIRTITDCRVLHLSPVSEPAYPTTDIRVALRSMEQSLMDTSTTNGHPEQPDTTQDPEASRGRRTEPTRPITVTSLEPRSGPNVTTSWSEVEARGGLLRPGDSFRSYVEARGLAVPMPSGGSVMLQDVCRRIVGGSRHRGIREEARASLAEGTDATGGIMVPDITAATVIDALRAKVRVIQAGASSMAVTSDTTKIARVITDPVPAPRAEAGPVVETDPAFDGVVVTPRSVACFFKVSNELLEDTSLIEPTITNVITASMARRVDALALYGTGTPPSPRGIASTVGVGSIPQAANGGALTSYATLLLAIRTALQANATFPQAAIMSPRTLIDYDRLTESASVFQPLRRPPLLENMPFLDTTSVPDSETQGSSGAVCSRVFVGDWPELVIAIRSELKITRAAELFVLNQQTAFVANMRFDVIVKHPASFSMLVGITASP